MTSQKPFSQRLHVSSYLIWGNPSMVQQSLTLYLCVFFKLKLTMLSGGQMIYYLLIQQAVDINKPFTSHQQSNRSKRSFKKSLAVRPHVLANLIWLLLTGFYCFKSTFQTQQTVHLTACTEQRYSLSWTCSANVNNSQASKCWNPMHRVEILIPAISREPC